MNISRSASVEQLILFAALGFLYGGFFLGYGSIAREMVRRAPISPRYRLFLGMGLVSAITAIFPLGVIVDLSYAVNDPADNFGRAFLLFLLAILTSVVGIVLLSNLQPFLKMGRGGKQ